MTRLLTWFTLTFAIMWCAAQTSAGDSASIRHADIQTLEHAFSSELHLKATHVPFMGLANGLVQGFSQGGVHALKVVTYESLPVELDHAMIAQLARVHLSGSWSMMVHEKARGDAGEDEMVWVQPAAERIRMLVIDLQADEMNLIQMELRPDQLVKWKEEHTGS